MDDYIEAIYDAALFVEVPVLKEKEEKPPMSVHAMVISMLLFTMSLIPLWQETYKESNMVFARHGTAMALGTGPFVMGSMVYGLVEKKRKEKHAEVAGLVLSLGQSIMSGVRHGVAPFMVLTIMTLLLFNTIQLCRATGKVGLTSALIVVNAAHQFFRGDVLSTMLTVAIVVIVAYINEMHIAVRLAHTKGRATTSVSLPVMYSGNTPLIVYYTLAEWSPVRIPLLVSLPCIYGICMHWPSIASQTGYDLARDYKEKGWTLKGWRDSRKVGAHLNRQIKTLTKYNGAILVAMTVVTAYIRPSVNCGTLLLVIQSLQSLLPTNELKSLQRRLRKVW